MSTELSKITPDQVMAKLDETNPGWWLEWADHQDLLDLHRDRSCIPATIRQRVIRKVWPLARAIYLISQEK